MTNLTKFVDFSFKIFQGIASYLTIILTSKFLSIPDYSYFSVLGIMLVSICTIDFGFNTKLINSYLSRCDSSSNRNQRTQNHIFLQLFAKRKKTLFKIFIFQIVLIIPSYSVIEKVFKTSHSFIYFMVTFSSLFIMFLGARFSSYLIALGKTRTLFKIQGFASLFQFFAIFFVGRSDLTLISYIPILAFPNLLVMIPICKDWLHILRNPSLEYKSSKEPEVPDAHLSASVQLMQFLQLFQGFAVPLILTRLYDELSFATVITQYRICMALLSSVGSLALSEWASVSKESLDGIERHHVRTIKLACQLLNKYFLLLGTIIVLLPLFGTCIWNFFGSKLPNPPLISWFAWGSVILFYESFTILSIVETSLNRYRVVLCMNAIQVLSCISLFYLPVLQSESNYPLNLALSYLVAIIGTLVIKR